MANPALGVRRRCEACGAPFYDLGRDPISCPKCGAVLVVEPVRPRRAARSARPLKAPPQAVLQPEEEANDAAVPLLDEEEEADAEEETDEAEPGKAT